jgi:hypothetical protein
MQGMDPAFPVLRQVAEGHQGRCDCPNNSMLSTDYPTCQRCVGQSELCQLR